MDSDSLSTLLDALHLTITGNIPQSVLQKADKRMKRYKEQINPLAYTSDCSSDTSLEEHSTAKKTKIWPYFGNNSTWSRIWYNWFPSIRPGVLVARCLRSRSLLQKFKRITKCALWDLQQEGTLLFWVLTRKQSYILFLCHSLSDLIVFFVKS